MLQPSLRASAHLGTPAPQSHPPSSPASAPHRGHHVSGPALTNAWDSQGLQSWEHCPTAARSLPRQRRNKSVCHDPAGNPAGSIPVPPGSALLGAARTQAESLEGAQTHVWLPSRSADQHPPRTKPGVLWPHVTSKPTHQLCQPTQGEVSRSWGQDHWALRGIIPDKPVST